MIRRLRSMLRAMLQRDAMDRAMDEEFALHLELRTEDLIRRGLTPHDAARRARLEFGNVTAAKENARVSWRTMWLERWLQDVRYSLRVLRLNPGFTIVALLSLGLGIGATTTVFSVIDAVDFRPLPYPDAGRLLWLSEVAPADDDFCAACPMWTSPSTAGDWSNQLRSVDAIAAAGLAFFTWQHDDVIESLRSVSVTTNFLPLLGVRPVLGRSFVPDDTLSGAAPVALVSNAFWRSRLGSTRDLSNLQLGSTSRPVNVIGVLPREFQFRDDPSLWMPLRLDRNAPRSSRTLAVIARLRDGLSIGAAASEVAALESRLGEANPEPFRGWTATAKPLRELFTIAAGKGRFIVFAVTALVLFVAVFNVAGLLLARSVARRAEFALRSTLGASRGRLIAQMLVEGSCVGIGGGLLGIAVASMAARMAPRWLSTAGTGLTVGLDGRMLVFALSLSVLVGLAASLAPALRVARDDLRDALGATSRVTSRASGVLITLQIALTLVLLTAAGLLGRDFVELRYLDLGYDPDNLYETSVPVAANADPDGWAVSAERLRARVATIPGVLAASLEHESAIHPTVVRAADDASYDAAASMSPHVAAVDDDYFRTLGARLLTGRGFTTADARGAPPTAVINAAAAHAFWPGQSPIGRQVYIADSPANAELLTVVGVIDDIERGEFIERHWPKVYRPFRQARIYHAGGSLEMRFDPGKPGAIAAAQTLIREAAGHPVSPLASAAEKLRRRLFPQRVNAIALQIFAIFGLLLAVMGIYGGVAYTVTRRTREIGIRLALGARRQSVITLMARRGLVLAGAGTAIGLVGALALVRVLRSIMIGTSPNPWIFAGAAAIMIVAALCATLVPATRATRMEAVAALRTQ